YYVPLTGNTTTIIEDREQINVATLGDEHGFNNKIFILGAINKENLKYRWIDDPNGRVNENSEPIKILQLNYNDANLLITTGDQPDFIWGGYAFGIQKIYFSDGSGYTIDQLLQEIVELGEEEAIVSWPVFDGNGAAGDDHLIGLRFNIDLHGGDGNDTVY